MCERRYLYMCECERGVLYVSERCHTHSPHTHTTHTRHSQTHVSRRAAHAHSLAFALIRMSAQCFPPTNTEFHTNKLVARTYFWWRAKRRIGCRLFNTWHTHHTHITHITHTSHTSHTHMHDTHIDTSLYS